MTPEEIQHLLFKMGRIWRPAYVNGWRVKAEVFTETVHGIQNGVMAHSHTKPQLKQVHCMRRYGVRLAVAQYHFKGLGIMMATIIWIVKDMAIVILYGLECEKFYIAIEDAETACIQLMKNRNCPGKYDYASTGKFTHPDKNLFYNIISVTTCLVLVLIYFYCIFKDCFHIAWEGLLLAKYVNYCFGYLVYVVGVIIAYFFNIKNRHSNVVFALKIQRICEIFKIHGKSLKSLIVINWVLVIVLNSYQIFWVFFFYYAFSRYGFPIEELVPNYFHIQFDVNAVHTSRIMKLMWQTLRTWLEGLQNVYIVEDEDVEHYWRNIIAVYKEIIEAYDIFRKSFQVLILSYVFHVFTNALLSIGLRIEIGKASGGKGMFALTAFISLLWLVRSMLIIITLSIESERLYTELKEVRSICIQIIGSNTCSEVKKRICKNILRIQKTSFRKFNACGLFVVDGMLPIQLCGLITTYLIVILQFEFL
ncbi:uncharacterized protein LOC124641418 [Helicoverpa zea]|uniref:uncharacterized protein LOC124641418 n=1 Tax=Helicoverpa zea TaxID=7113 RepID=UPI001F5A5538|nr:uncharacterized protein LOC124641418 [Helicoverpa zea]